MLRSTAIAAFNEDNDNDESCNKQTMACVYALPGRLTGQEYATTSHGCHDIADVHKALSTLQNHKKLQTEKATDRTVRKTAAEQHHNRLVDSMLQSRLQNMVFHANLKAFLRFNMWSFRWQNTAFQKTTECSKNAT